MKRFNIVNNEREIVKKIAHTSKRRVISRVFLTSNVAGKITKLDQCLWEEWCCAEIYGSLITSLIVYIIE